MLDIAFSPCPNDTFIFFALANNLLSSPLKVKTHYDDGASLYSSTVRRSGLDEN